MPTELRTSTPSWLCRRCKANANLTTRGRYYCWTCWDRLAAKCHRCNFSDLRHFFVRVRDMYFCANCAASLKFCEVCRERLVKDGCCHECKNETPPAPPVGTDDYAPTRWFGVELESSAGDFAAIRSARPEGWETDSDPSITGKEYVSPPLYGDWGLERIRDFCKLARQHGVKVNRQCGLHLHIEAHNLTHREITKVVLGYLITYYSFWRRVVPPSRRGNHFCNDSDQTYNIDDLMAGKLVLPASRYFWVNTLALNIHGTVEIRLHSATFNPVKIVNWVKANIKFFQAVKSIKVDDIMLLTRKDVERIIGPHLAHYYMQREAKFSA